jgi:poly-gamma-glutamate synthesis protein (capsule biosynthesis protein)
MTSSLGYVALAERLGGPIPRAVPPDHVWGDALDDLAASAPDLRIVNLETAVTLANDAEPKGINYRMNPANVPCLTVARIDCCVLANNHVLDWGRQGLADTLAALAEAGIRTAGAGRNLKEAQAPAVLSAGGKCRLVIHAVACPSSGVPPEWAARPEQPGVHWVTGRIDASAERLAQAIARDRRPGDIVMLSIHWGGNWGYDISAEDREFARFLIDHAGVGILHGHSSHHPKGLMLHRHRAVLFGCGDLINDYEGIGGHEAWRPDLSLIYLLTLEPGGECSSLQMLPYRIGRFRLNRAGTSDRQWLASMLSRECGRLGADVALGADGRLILVP